MKTKSLQEEYSEKLSSTLQKLNLKVDIFQARASKATGLAKAKYLEEVKNIQEKQELLDDAIRKINEMGNQLDRSDFRKKIDHLLDEIEKATEEEKQRLIDLLG
ncbi:MAG: hypothetical protein AB1611_03680 [bacterium]